MASKLDIFNRSAMLVQTKENTENTSELVSSKEKKSILA